MRKNFKIYPKECVEAYKFDTVEVNAVLDPPMFIVKDMKDKQSIIIVESSSEDILNLQDSFDFLNNIGRESGIIISGVDWRVRKMDRFQAW